MSKRRIPYELPPAPPQDRLNAMFDALDAAVDGGKPLDLEMCLEINRALIYVAARLDADLLSKRRGAPTNWTTLRAATIACELMDEYGATAKHAALAALPRGTAAQCKTVERACRSLRRRFGIRKDRTLRSMQVTDFPIGPFCIVSPHLVDEAALRLRKLRKSGNR